MAGAVHDFAAGRRREAREALDHHLDAAESSGLRIPRMAYRYEEKTATKVFALTLEVSYGAGLLQGGSTYQLGLGLRSRGEPEGSLTASLAPVESAKGDEEAARYHVHAAALAAVYHLLEGDEARGTEAARRALAVLTAGARLGARAVRSAHPATLGIDARGALAVAAQLAAEAGMPFLAGDLWTVVRQGLPEGADDPAITGILDPAPFGLTGIAALEPILARTRRSLRVVALRPRLPRPRRPPAGSREDARRLRSRVRDLSAGRSRRGLRGSRRPSFRVTSLCRRSPTLGQGGRGAPGGSVHESASPSSSKAISLRSVFPKASPDSMARRRASPTANETIALDELDGPSLVPYERVPARLARNRSGGLSHARSR